MRPQLVIPMTGVGQRFVDANYAEIKPLIKIGGSTIIQHVMSMYPEYDDPIFIISNSHAQQHKLSGHLQENWPSSKILKIPAHKKGPSWAIKSIEQYLPEDRSIIINYCDFSGKWDVNELENVLKFYDGGIVTYTGFHPHMLRNHRYAYVQKDEGGRVTAIQEKEPYTSNPMMEEASAGIYGFRNKAILMSALNKQFKENLSLNGEFYTSLTYKPMIENHQDIRTICMTKFYQWGTPEDLKDWEYWYRAVAGIYNKTELDQIRPLNGAAVILAAGLGSRVAEVAKTPKPLIEIGEHKLYEYSINASENCYPRIIFTRKELASHFPNRDNLEIIDVPKITRGQADSAQIAAKFVQRKKLEEYFPITFLSADNIIYSGDFDSMHNVQDWDVIVWTSIDYPPAGFDSASFSWVEVGDDSVQKVSFKQLDVTFKNPQVMIGNFSFKSIELFDSLVNELFMQNIQIKNEFYLDSLIKLSLDSMLKVKVLRVHDFFSVGTENEYLTFKYFSEIYSENMSKFDVAN